MRGVGVTHGRIGELDSIRGIAAVSVMVSHLTLVIPVMAANTTHEGSSVNWLKYTPLHAFFAGNAAVITFFVLSGFVLSLPFLRGHVPYGKFAIRRVMRIYPPYVVAVLTSIVLAQVVARHGDGLSGWFTRKWTAPLTASSVIDHLTLIWSFPSHQDDWNPVIWSLIYEMRISLIFPLLVLVVMRSGWQITLGLAALSSLVGWLGPKAADHVWRNDWLTTFRYIPMFLVGILLAQHAAQLVDWWQRRGRALHFVWLPLALTIYAYTYLLSDHRLAHAGPLNEWTACIGSAMVMLLALASPPAQRFLGTRPLLFLGRVSYSLYLYHLIVILTLVNLLHGKLPLGLLLPLCAVVSVGVAAVAYSVVEVPAIALGRRLTASRADARTAATLEEAATAGAP